MVKETKIINLEQGFLYTTIRVLSAVTRVEFVSDRMSYAILRDRWCHVIVLNVHALSGDSKVSFMRN
jgi:hypothetical protein